MFGTAVDQLRFAVSVALGIRFSPSSLERLADATRETLDEFGAIEADGSDLLTGPMLDQRDREAIQLRRFRALARSAARQTSYYKQLFDRVRFDPSQVRWHQDIIRIPITSKEALRRLRMPSFRGPGVRCCMP